MQWDGLSKPVTISSTENWSNVIKKRNKIVEKKRDILKGAPQCKGLCLKIYQQTKRNTI